LWLLLLMPVLAGAELRSDDPQIQQLLEQTRSQLEAMSRHARQAGEQLASLRQRLAESERLNRLQADRIEILSRQVEQSTQQRAAIEADWRVHFFADLGRRLADSPLVTVDTDRLVIPTDAVFVFGTGEIGSEGRDRLGPVAEALIESLLILPPDLDWRLEVAGHTDRRPLRGNARFPSNWELSTARAVAVLRFLHERGISSPRLVAAGYAATEPVDEAINKAAHRRNRRVEIRLVLR
jgi:chemotaxis protein MotB